MCLPHTSQFLWEDNCRPYLNPTKISQVLKASRMFSLGWCPEMLKFVSLFLIPQSHAGFLLLLANHLQRLTLMVCGSTCKNQAQEGEWGRYGWDMWSIRDDHGPFEFLEASSLQQLVGRFSGVCKPVSSVPLMSSEHWLLCSHSLSEPLQITSVIQVRWESGPFGQCPAQLGKPAIHSHAPVVELQIEEGLSWYQAMLPWGMVMQAKWKCLSYALQCI